MKTTKCIREFGMLAMSACAAGMAGASEDLTVAVGETKTIATTASYGAVSLGGTLEVKGGRVCADEIAVGGTATDYAVLSVSGANAEFGSNTVGKTLATIGAGGRLGRLTVSGGGKLSLYSTTLATDAVADPTTGTIDFLDLGSGSFSMSGIDNQSGKKARVLFRGGQMQMGQVWGAQMFPTQDKAKTVVFEGVEGADIDIALSGGDSGVHLNGLVTQGDCDFRMRATRYVYNANLALNHSGWVTIGGGGNVVPNQHYSGTVFGENVQGVTITGGTGFRMAQNVYLVSANLDATGAVLTASSELKEWNLKVADGEVGFFRATMPATLRKIGKGTLEIDAASSVSNAAVVAGTVCIKAPFSVTGTLTLAAGTTLKVMGKLTVGELVDNGATLELCEGGEIVYATEDTRQQFLSATLVA